MPLLVRCENLQPGMRLAEPFVWRGRVMLSEGTELTQIDCDSLQNRFPNHSVRVMDPMLEAMVDFEDDSHERQVARVAQRIVADCMAEVQDRFSTHASLDGLSIRGIHTAVSEVIEYLRTNPVSLALLDNFRGGDHYLSERAGNVFYLAMLLGAANRDYVTEERRRLTAAPELSIQVTENLGPLGMGAMLMDLGMMSLQHLFSQDEPMTPEIWQRIREHPIIGAELLKDEFAASTKMVVRTHHERLDGSGYPQGLGDDQLHVFSRIVRIADAYDAGTSCRVYKEAKSPVRILWEMTVGPCRKYYDQTLMRTFARLIQPFPIGAKVRLKDRRYGVVVKYNRENPVQPHIIVAFDSRNRRIPDAMLEGVLVMGSCPELRAASFRGEDLSFIYEEQEDQSLNSRVGVWPSLFEAAYP